MAGPVLRDGTGVPWESAAGSPAPPSLVSSLSEMSAGSSPSPDLDDSTGVERQDPVSPPDGRQIIKPSPQSVPANRHSFASVEPHKPYHRLTNSLPNPSTRPPRAVGPVHASSCNISSDALSRSPKNSPATGTREPAEHDAVLRPILVEHQVLEAHIDDQFKPVPEVQSEGRDTRDDGAGSARGRLFRIEWIRTAPLPFFCTRHLRNPWNHGREVKVSRDGTELEPNVGQRLLDEWDIPLVSLDSSPGPSRTPERRGSKSTPQLLPN
jgi:hypothetical protein